MTERVQLQVRKKYIPLLVITMKPIGFATDTIIQGNCPLNADLLGLVTNGLLERCLH